MDAGTLRQIVLENEMQRNSEKYRGVQRYEEKCGEMKRNEEKRREIIKIQRIFFDFGHLSQPPSSIQILFHKDHKEWRFQ